MNILEKMRAEPTYMRRDLGFNRLDVTALDAHETGEIRPAGMATSKEYMLTLKLGVSFWANQAQYEDALKLARKRMVRLIHEDVLTAVDALKSAVMAEDAESVVMYANQIQKAIEGDL